MKRRRLAPQIRARAGTTPTATALGVICTLVLLSTMACTSAGAGTPDGVVDDGLAQAVGRQMASAAAGPSTRPSPGPTAAAHPTVAEWRGLWAGLSEPNGDFFSDNFISNETSYLQVADALAERTQPGGVYLGVGPEQNFSYIALSRARWAYLIDIRRDNMVLHLLYKALFDLAQDRAHFLAMLTGRESPPPKLADDAPLAAVLAAAESQTADEASFAAVHQRLRHRIVDDYGLSLDDEDTRSLRRAHRAFLADSLDIRFRLRDEGVRRYPSLRELLTARAPEGARGGFLSRDASFRFLQRMQREHRIVPLVGDFAGDRAMPGLAQHLRTRGEVVSTFYVSNVEQYLMRDGLWWKWQRNVAALPSNADSVFIRAYLDQGQRHSQQLDGHRTATTLHRIGTFVARRTPYRSMHALASDQLLASE